ncbi:unnamed protein product [Cyprideis torosa]|uniref:Protein arginine N-methyltransferase 7 n=1 Tax=Cyprideis torosa TaxID=163714 RepID=A0A7R8ZND3_9CRUS|nr:unnamed protein product [Cyprideis torosa]CAG0887593.1 unnamed protein product [Cyprideis torosa]
MNPSSKIFAQSSNPLTGKMEWIEQEEQYDFHQEVAASSYGDMLHDKDRNIKYHEALKKVIRQMKQKGKEVHVLDIGTGTGLLAMMAARLGADSVVACEAFVPMAQCCLQVLKDNGLEDKVLLISKRSTELKVGVDLTRRANLLVTEVFDTELIGEGAIGTFNHAREELLEEDAIVIPSRSRIYGQLVSSPSVTRWKQIYPISYKGDYLYPPSELNQCLGSPGVHDIHLDEIPEESVLRLSEKFVIFEFDFTKPLPTKACRRLPVLIPGARGGMCDGLFFWWDLDMDSEGTIQISCSPTRTESKTLIDQDDVKDVISKSPWREHWMQAVYYFAETRSPRPFTVFGSEGVNLVACHDEYSHWFDIEPLLPDEESSIQPSIPVCSCGIHMVMSRQRIAAINDQRRHEYWNRLIGGIKSHVDESGMEVVAYLPDEGSWILGLLLLKQIGSKVKHVYFRQTNHITQRLLKSFISANRLDKTKVTVLSRDVEQITEGDFENCQPNMILAEPFSPNARAPWHHLMFLMSLPDFLKKSKDLLIFPGRATIRAVAVDFQDLWKIRAPVRHVEGFNLSAFDELIERSSVLTRDAVEPHPLWEYPGKALSKPFTVASLDLQEHRDLPTDSFECSVSLGGSGVLNGIAFWMEWYSVDLPSMSSPCRRLHHFSTGPIADVVLGERISWDPHVMQGVHFTPEHHLVGGVGDKLDVHLVSRAKFRNNSELDLNFEIHCVDEHSDDCCSEMTKRELGEDEVDVVEKRLKTLDEQEPEDKKPSSVSSGNQPRLCPFLDTINRSVLDFDFEKLCSVSLSRINVYACLVCGKYFQGRGQATHAYTHSVADGHHVFLNLETHRFYCLPDNYEIIDSSLNDILYLLNPTFTAAQIKRIDQTTKMSRALDGTLYHPGNVGLNNIKANDYCNVVLQALSHVPPLRDFFLDAKNLQGIKHAPGDNSIELVRRFGELMRKLWNPRNFKAHVSPHEMLQAVVLCSKKRFQITEQGDSVEFLCWILNALHLALGGTRKRNSSVIYKAFQGQMRVYTRKMPPVDLEQKERDKLLQTEEYQESSEDTPFLYLSADLPPPPLFKDELKENIIPQVNFFVMMSKFNAMTEKTLTSYRGNMVKRYEIRRLPPYIIVCIKLVLGVLAFLLREIGAKVEFEGLLFLFESHQLLFRELSAVFQGRAAIGRFTKNNFFVEKNPTIVNFPIRGVDFGEFLTPEIRAKHDRTVYDLLANIVHDGQPGAGKGTYRVHVQHVGSGQWFEMQDLMVRDILPPMITLTEAYIQIYQLRLTDETDVAPMDHDLHATFAPVAKEENGNNQMAGTEERSNNTMSIAAGSWMLAEIGGGGVPTVSLVFVLESVDGCRGTWPILPTASMIAGILLIFACFCEARGMYVVYLTISGVVFAMALCFLCLWLSAVTSGNEAKEVVVSSKPIHRKSLHVPSKQQGPYGFPLRQYEQPSKENNLFKFAIEKFPKSPVLIQEVPESPKRGMMRVPVKSPLSDPPFTFHIRQEGSGHEEHTILESSNRQARFDFESAGLEPYVMPAGKSKCMRENAWSPFRILWLISVFMYLGVTFSGMLVTGYALANETGPMCGWKASIKRMPVVVFDEDEWKS